MSSLVFFGLAGGITLLLLLRELKVRSFRESFWADRKRAARNYAYLIGSLVTLTLIRKTTPLMAEHLPQLFPIHKHFVLDVVGIFLGAELLNYVIHYVKHTHPWLWRFHFQHHRETKFNLWLTAHVHVGEVFVSGMIMSAILTSIGFSPTATQIYFLFYSLVNTYQHTGKEISLGVLDRIIVGPRYHRLHHALKMKGNFGSTLVFWDVVFGTAHWPEHHKSNLKVGIRENGEPWGFWREFTWFLVPGRRAETTQTSEKRKTSPTWLGDPSEWKRPPSTPKREIEPLLPTAK
ncbi:MAG: sterol desaturase family protein [Planctomycetota bacterium]|nr:sterol desaturase family protein [Planctomycetota bacterium]